MEHSTALISLSLLTLLAGMAIAAYQLWAADDSQKKGNHSALAARFGGKPMARPTLTAAPPVATAQPAAMQVSTPATPGPITAMKSTPPRAPRKKGPGRSAQAAPTPDADRPTP